MDFSPPPTRRRATESIVPMINVVFLLLIFFLMSASIAPPEPFEVSVPSAEATQLEKADPDTFYVSAKGDYGYAGARDQAALAALSRHPTGTILTLRVDANLPASELAQLLPKIAAAGVTSTQLVTGDK
jgi:biopolymer transport protein ExbD